MTTNVLEGGVAQDASVDPRSLLVSPVAPDAASPLVPSYAMVTVSGGVDAGLRFALSAARTSVGRGPMCDLRLSDPVLAPLHCEFEAAPEGVHVRVMADEAVWIRGVAVRDALLPFGSSLALGQTVLRLEDSRAARPAPLAPLVVESAAMRQLMAMLESAAPGDAPLLITGETGTGKALVAAHVHATSRRAAGPLVRIDCRGLDPHTGLVEVFGHALPCLGGRGAAANRLGLIEQARGGSVIFDEIAELPSAYQARLVGMLDGAESSRDGRPPAARLIATTRHELRAEVTRGRFREDLYYRLAVCQVTVPPLRERIEDLPALVRLLTAAAAEPGLMPAPEALSQFMALAWPGNVRELRNALERLRYHQAPAVIAPEVVSVAPRVAVDDTMQWPIDTSRAFKEAKHDLVDAFERRYIGKLLATCDGNISAAARRAGIDRMSIHKMLHRLGLAAGPK